MLKLNSACLFFLSYRPYELYQFHWHEQQNKCHRIKGKEDPYAPVFMNTRVPECRCVCDLLLLFQIKLLIAGRSFLPSSLPEVSTDNEVDTPHPTPIGPPLYLPPGINTPQNMLSDIYSGDIEELFLDLLMPVEKVTKSDIYITHYDTNNIVSDILYFSAYSTSIWL